VRWDALLAKLAEDDEGLGFDPHLAQMKQLLESQLVGIE